MGPAADAMLWAFVCFVAASPPVQLPPPPAVVEFYAPWCPVCQRFAPHWAAVADAVQPPVVAVSVDCDASDCAAWGVRAYPTVVMMTAGSEVDVYTGPFSSDSLAAWLARDHGVSFAPRAVATTAAPPARHPAPRASVDDAFAGFDALIPPSIESAADYVAATTLARALTTFPRGRARYECVLQALSTGRSARGCPEVPVGAPTLCKGRFPCVVWALLHTLVALAPSDSTAVEWLSVSAVAVMRWFPCTECVEHFSGMVSGTAESFPLASVKSRRGAVLWLWNAHNAVNGRRGVGVFPFPGMCDGCTSENDVFELLERVYGGPRDSPDADYSRSGTVAATTAVLIIAGCTAAAVVYSCRHPLVPDAHTVSLLETEPDEAPPVISVPSGDEETVV